MIDLGEARAPAMHLDWTEPDIWRAWLHETAATAEAAAPADVARQLRARFAAVRAFHAARPIDTAAYYDRGIQPLSLTRWHHLVNECFLSDIEDPVLSSAIVQARDVQFDMVRDGRVHFCCDQRLLEQRDGYSLIFGSLSLLAVAIRIDKEFGTDFKEALRSRGRPIIFVCDVPTAMVEDDALAGLVGCLRAAHVHMDKTNLVPSPLGFHFSIPNALPAAAIVGHRQPGRVIDAVYGRHLE